MPQILRDVASINESIFSLFPTKSIAEAHAPSVNSSFLAKGLPEGYKGWILTGIYGQANVKNKNGRIYSDKLWEGVCNSQEFKQRLQNHTAIGNLSHPEYTEPSLLEGALILTDLTFDKESGYVIGTSIPAVGTPNGDLLEAWLNLGVKPAVSSRGVGDVDHRSGGEYVNESTYVYIVHDLTLDPSVGTAWPTVVKQESISQFKSDVASILEKYAGTMNATDKHLYAKLVESVSTKPSLSEAMTDFCACNFLTIPHKATSHVTEELNPQRSSFMPDTDKFTELVTKLSDLTEAKVRLVTENLTLSEKNLRLEAENVALLKVKADYNKSIQVVETLTTRISDAKSQVQGAEKKVLESEKKLANAAEALTEIARRYKVLEMSHNEILNAPLMLEKAMEVIAELRTRYLVQKKALAESDKKLSVSTEVALKVRDKVRESKINELIDDKLAAFGGRKALGTLFEGCTTVERAQKIVDTLLAKMPKSAEKPIYESHVPIFGLKTDPNPKEPVQKTPSAILESYGKKKDLITIFQNVH